MSEAVKLSIVADSEDHNMLEKKPTVGERLAYARSQQEMTVEQIAGQLKWSVRQIAEIEAGNYSVFSDLLTVRGFVRTYAKILKIDSVPLLEELSVEIEKLPTKTIDRPKLDTPFPAGEMPWRHNSNPQKITGVVLVVILCLLAAFVYRDALLNFEHGILPPKSEILTTSIEAAPGKADVREAVNPPDRNAAVGNIAGAPDTKVQPDQNDAPVAAHSSPGPVLAELDAPAGIETAQSKAIQQSQKQLVSDGTAANALVLKFRQDCWLQIKRADGSVLVSHLVRAGSEEVFAVTEPLNLVVGNAPGVDATLRGQKLVFPVQIGSNVVNLSIK